MVIAITVSRANHQLICIDLLGRGGSVVVYSTPIAAVLDELELESAPLHSVGAAISRY